MFATLLEVRQSSVKNAGNGVFTLKKIKKWSPVCYYAGVDGDDEEVDPENVYTIGHPGSDMARVGHPYQEGSHGVAQLINDGACPDFNKLPKTEAGVDLGLMSTMLEIYTLVSYSKRNVSLADLKNSPLPVKPWVFYALRDIDEGEELFFPYGVKYWLYHFKIRNKHFKVDYGLPKIIPRIPSIHTGRLASQVEKSP